MKKIVFVWMMMCTEAWASYTMRPGYDVKATENLFEAIKADDFEKVSQAIAAGADVRAVNNRGWTPLHWAAAKNAVNAIKLLIEKGANVHAVTNNGSTSLHLAAHFKAVNTVKWLIENGANVNVVEEHGWTPLFVVAWQNYADIIKLLIEKGANVYGMDKNGYTALYNAVISQAVDSVKLLIEEGLEIPYRLNDADIAWLDQVITEINEERKTKKKEMKALSALVHEQRRNLGIIMTGMQLLDAGSLEELPLASEVYAQRAAAKKT